MRIICRCTGRRRFTATPWREPLAPDAVRLGGGGGGLVFADLPGDESRVGGGQIICKRTKRRFVTWTRTSKAKASKAGCGLTVIRAGDVVFEWNMSRSREGPREFLKYFHGKLQTDGYGVYESLARERGGELTLIGCWAHARRGVHEALGEGRAAAWLVGQIGQLYAVEKTLRAQKAGPNRRAAVRAWQSRPILARLRRALEIVRRRVLPQSVLGQAIDYILARWEALIRYVDDGRLEVDNNLCENSIRPTAVGKKNFLFIGHPEAGQRSAVIYSVLGSCRRHGINPAEYLQDVFERLPKAKTSEVKSLTPAAWAKAKRNATRQSA